MVLHRERYLLHLPREQTNMSSHQPLSTTTMHQERPTHLIHAKSIADKGPLVGCCRHSKQLGCAWSGSTTNPPQNVDNTPRVKKRITDSGPLVGWRQHSLVGWLCFQTRPGPSSWLSHPNTPRTACHSLLQHTVACTCHSFAGLTQLIEPPSQPIMWSCNCKGNHTYTAAAPAHPSMPMHNRRQSAHTRTRKHSSSPEASESLHKDEIHTCAHYTHTAVAAAALRLTRRTAPTGPSPPAECW